MSNSLNIFDASKHKSATLKCFHFFLTYYFFEFTENLVLSAAPVMEPYLHQILLDELRIMCTIWNVLLASFVDENLIPGMSFISWKIRNCFAKLITKHQNPKVSKGKRYDTAPYFRIQLNQSRPWLKFMITRAHN